MTLLIIYNRKDMQNHLIWFELHVGSSHYKITVTLIMTLSE
jgi:hypothetical protein